MGFIIENTLNAKPFPMVYLSFKQVYTVFLNVVVVVVKQAAMDRFSPQQRDCYSEGEIELKYLPSDHGYRYEMSNCLFEATFEHILSVTL